MALKITLQNYSSKIHIACKNNVYPQYDSGIIWRIK